mgnify:CR=1 FL=1
MGAPMAYLLFLLLLLLYAIPRKSQALCGKFTGLPSPSAAERVLPLLHILDLIVHGAVAVVAGLGELAFREGGADGAALLGAVGATGELARAEVRPELREGVFQIFFRDEARPAGSRLAKPGVSAMRPPKASKMVTSRVV